VLGFDPAGCADAPASGVVPGPRCVGARGLLRAWLLEQQLGPGADALRRRLASVGGRVAHGLGVWFLATPAYSELVLAAYGGEGDLRHAVLQPRQGRAADVDLLTEIADAGARSGVELGLRVWKALDRARLTQRFFRDFRAQRELVARGWTGIPQRSSSARRQLALLLLCRIMFLFFLQRQGYLAGDREYLLRQVRAVDGRLYRRLLQPLFFGCLNRRAERRTAAAAALGALPYLNGGLFERHSLERRYRSLSLPDALIRKLILEFFDRFRFTMRDEAQTTAGAAELAIDPEMLGRVFEGLMAPAARSASGTFFTPASTVAPLVDRALEVWLSQHAPESPACIGELFADAPMHTAPRNARMLEAVRGIRLLDPACGSGAFLMGALDRLARLRTTLGEGSEGARRDIVARNLYGVDLQQDAALLCALRLWLALTLDAPAAVPPPLPNLDRRIRQGDALLAPVELVRRADRLDGRMRAAVRELESVGLAYLQADPEARPGLTARLRRCEAALARHWLRRRRAALGRERAELRILADARDLFGAPAEGAARAQQALDRLRREADEIERVAVSLGRTGALPFFSFPIHFAEAGAGFDLVVSNPPWVRAHLWSASLRMLRTRFEVCRAHWRRGVDLARVPPGAAAQTDIAFLFFERSAALLAPGGVLAMLLPAKFLRSLNGAGVRRLLLTEVPIRCLTDHSLDQHAIFRADAFAAAVVAARAATSDSRNAAIDREAAASHVDVTLTRRGVRALSFTVARDELPLIPGDLEAPWLLAPPDVLRVLRRMQRAGAPLGTTRRVRRGVVTGANRAFIARRVEPKLGGLAFVWPEAAPEGADPLVIESAALAPLVRGRGIRAWSYSADHALIWPGAPATAAARQPRLTRYLDALPAHHRRGPRHLTRATLAPKVAWHDLADSLHAVALPARVSTRWVGQAPLVPLNTVYFVPVSSDDDALLLAAVLNSLPIRTFARAAAERAKDARFRFFAWTIAALPFATRLDAARTELIAIARAAHVGQAIDAAAAERLDAIVTDAYGLGSADVDVLRGFDAWLRGGSDA
ncbi:MAG: Eco57I restriction-modification methylase domain-containing protein, partial [Longimicrobiales bacterium]